MSALRVVLVTRRFWPLAGGAETATANLARGLLELGAAPLIVTARFDPRWPGEVVYREIPVHRLPFSPGRFGWGTMRYMIGLSRWLRKNHPDIDLVCVSRMSHESHAVLGAHGGTNIPVVIRAEPDETFGLFQSRKTDRMTTRIVRRCQTADAVVATSKAVMDQLLEAGFDRRRVRCIPDGVQAAAPRSSARKTAARTALCQVNEDLRVPSNKPVALFIGRLHPRNRLDDLVAAWQLVARKWPHARLWLIGDGPQREDLFRQIRAADLLGRVLLPGTFDDVEDLLQASDLMVLPASLRAQPLALLEAMAAGLPVLVADSRYDHNLVKAGVTGRTFGEADCAALADAIMESFNDPECGNVLAAAATERVERLRSLGAMATSHFELFHQLVRGRKRSVS